MRTLEHNIPAVDRSQVTFDRSQVTFDRSRPTRRLRTAIRILRAFTLIEMLVAVGAVALIAVGLSKLFASTGETIKTGRRISALNEAASTLERQFRKDIASIAGSGEGIMVIRNKLLSAPVGLSPGTNNGILLSADDRNANPRKRRVDEITFFATGAFTSAREPQHIGRIAAGAAAQIYYGHGQRLDNYDNLTIFSDPLWHDTTSPRVWPTVGTGGLGENGPNRYAGTWTLLRHTTVLARQQKTAGFPSGAALANPLTPTMWPDTVTQIALEPASTSIFRFDPLVPGQGGADVLGHGYKAAVVNGSNLTINAANLKLPPQNTWARPNETRDWPSRVSGMVDIAAVDLTLVKARIVGAGADPNKPASPNFLQDDSFVGLGIPVRMQAMNPTIADLTSTNYKDTNPLHAQKMLMASAMPSSDPWLFSPGSVATPTQATFGNNANAYHEQRMIYAAETPDFTGNLNTGHLGTRYNDAAEPYHRQDQAMLGSSIITPGCTWFQVDWSFGDVERDAAGHASIIWHGLGRPYRGIPASNTFGLTADVVYNDHNTATSAALIHWPVPQDFTTPLPATQDIPLYSFFGYLDPTTSPSSFADWPWPRLLRVTYTLTDPSDPSVEQTYQFVVQVSAQQRRSS